MTHYIAVAKSPPLCIAANPHPARSRRLRPTKPLGPPIAECVRQLRPTPCRHNEMALCPSRARSLFPIPDSLFPNPCAHRCPNPGVVSRSQPNVSSCRKTEPSDNVANSWSTAAALYSTIVPGATMRLQPDAESNCSRSPAVLMTKTAAWLLGSVSALIDRIVLSPPSLVQPSASSWENSP